MEYFGRNLFVMNILQTVTVRKNVKTKELSPGNGGEGVPPRGKNETANKIANKEEREPRTSRRIIVLKRIQYLSPEPHPSEPRTELQKAP
jgi:hypothetical protein